MLSREKHGSQCRRAAHDPRAGFTIVEVGIAALVLALVLSTSLIALQRGFMAIDNARYTTLAGQILQSQMEKLRLLTWTQLTTATGHPTTGPFTPDLQATTSGQLANFTCTQTITDSPAPYTSYTYGMKDIVLTATWKGSDGRTRSLTYFTRYGQIGISDFFYTTH
jgi:type II secretory pathway pseudopilin PulG